MRDLWLIDLRKKVEEQELCFSANIMLSNFSAEWNNNSLAGTNNLRPRKKDKDGKEKEKEGKPIKNLLDIDEE
jgi:hypothetical protein